MAAADRSSAAPAQLDTDTDTARSHPHASGLDTSAKSNVLKAWREPRGEQPRAAGLLLPDKGPGTSPSLKPKGCGTAGNAFSQGEQFPMSLPPPKAPVGRAVSPTLPRPLLGTDTSADHQHHPRTLQGCSPSPKALPGLL